MSVCGYGKETPETDNDEEEMKRSCKGRSCRKTYTQPGGRRPPPPPLM